MFGKDSAISHENPNVDALVLDGGCCCPNVAIYQLQNIEQYAVDIFLPYVRSQLHSVGRLAVVWDRYTDGTCSLKASGKTTNGASATCSPISCCAKKLGIVFA